MSAVVAGVGGQQRVEGKAEETVERRAAGIDGSNARRCQHDILLACVGTDILQEC